MPKNNYDGTTSSTYQIDAANSGPQLKNSGGTMQVRNAADSDYVALEAADGTFSGNVTIQGDLTVEGSPTTILGEVVRYEDNYLDLNANYTTAAAQAGGLVVNYLPTATTDTVAAGGFTGATTVATTGAATFSAGDIIQISSADDPGNNALFEVASHAANVLTIDSTPAEGFSKGAFVTDSTVAGDITKVTVSVLRAGTDGTWETGSGATVPITYTDLEAALSAGDGIDIAAQVVSADVSDFAGTGIEDDGANNLRLAAQGAGIGGGAGSTLTLDLSSVSGGTFSPASDTLVYMNAGAATETDAWPDIAALVAGDGLKAASGVFAVEPNDFAGSGLEDDGADNLRIAAAAAGSGLTGGGGSALAVGAGTGITVNADDVQIADNGVNAAQIGTGPMMTVRFAAPSAASGTTDSTLALPAGSRVHKVVVDITAAYDGTPTLDVGSTADDDLYVDQTTIDATVLDSWVFDGLDIAAGATAVRCTIGGTPMAGDANIIVTYSTPSA